MPQKMAFMVIDIAIWIGGAIRNLRNERGSMSTTVLLNMMNRFGAFGSHCFCRSVHFLGSAFFDEDSTNFFEFAVIEVDI